MAISSAERAIIRFSRQEVTRIGKVIDEYRNTLTQEEKMQVFNMFAPKMKERAKIVAARHNISEQDYLNDLYLTFFEQLDINMHKKTYGVFSICKELNKTLPTDYIPIAYNRKTVDQLAESEFNQQSYRIDEQSQSEKKEKFMAVIDSVLSRKQKFMLEKFMQGLSMAEIQQYLHRAQPEIAKYFEKIFITLRQPEIKDRLKAIYCENASAGDVVLHEDDIVVLPKTGKKKELAPELVRETVQRNASPMNVAAELEGIMAVQTKYASLFRNIYLIKRVQNFLKKDPSFRFKIKLPQKCDNDEFKSEVERMSVETFGINIFEFI